MKDNQSKMSVLNLNIGILGHVDSGKTSLAKVLSSTSSTACYDKNPQSQERGITIDLGFSSLIIDSVKNPISETLKMYSKLQYTFVDCPGHASLIKTIIGGAQIIDLMILVVDITKGIQTQTAECLVIGEILCPRMVVVLNKVDQLPEDKRQTMIEKMKRRMQLTLKDTVFKEAPIIPVAANPPSGLPVGIAELVDKLESNTFVPDRHPEKPLVFSVDHCFSIKGQGTVMTGTMWQGTIKINDIVEIPSLGLTKKVKSMQIYRKNVEKSEAGDRVAVCVTQFDPKLLERGIVCSPGLLSPTLAVLTTIHHVKYYKGQILSKAKFHITIGHDTVIGKLTIFCEPRVVDKRPFNFEDEYLYCSSLCDPEHQDYETTGHQFALLEFEKPMFVVSETLFIGSKLDMDVHSNSCRIAFYGRVIETFSDKNYIKTVLPKLKIYKNKSKTGVVDRVVNDHEVVCKDIFKKETRIDLFTGLKVTLSTGENGIIDGGFGQTGKIRVSIPRGLLSETIDKAGLKKSKKHKADINEASVKETITVELKFKQFIFDLEKNIVQSKDR